MSRKKGTNFSGYGFGFVRGTLKTSCHALGLKHFFTKPCRRQTNGKAERSLQTITRE
jgi:hypothetical protein